jgi:hypothetical protein
MALPFPLAGVDFTADALTYMLPLVAVKPTDQTVTSSTVVVSDTALFLPVLPSSKYEIDLVMTWTGVASNATPGLKYDFTLPAGATFANFTSMGYAAGAFAFNIENAGTPASYASGATTSNHLVRGLLVVGVTAGNFQLQWAQGISSATSTVMKANSFLTARRIA